MADFGDEEGAVCWRNGCQGVIALADVEGCSCHISPPCGPCTTPREFCPVCEWRAKDWDDSFNGFSVKYADRKQGIIARSEPRPLDPRKIDYRILAHSNSSQKCVGIYPEGTTPAQVEALVKGTFGGRFNQFGDGRFEYIAYTD
jgi:hypothetical protein